MFVTVPLLRQMNLFRNDASKRPSTRFSLELLLCAMRTKQLRNTARARFDWLIRIGNSGTKMVYQVWSGIFGFMA